MTVEAFSSLPFSAGSAVAAAAGRAALLGVGVYMRAPLRNTAIAALVVLSALAGSNALYRQAHHHPSPLFGSFDQAAAPAKSVKAKTPVMPVAKPLKLKVDTTETTGSVDPAMAVLPRPIGNAEVLALQTKLAALGLFTGTADGMFGPRTAKAIKAFEQQVGRTPRGLLTQQILDLIAAAPMQAPAAAPAAVTVATPPVVEAARPLPAPTPLTVSPDTAATTAPDDAPTASIDAAAGVETVQMNASPAVVPKRTVQTIAVHAELSQAIPAPLAPATEGQDASTDPETVAAVQRGLNSLGFLHGEIDGVAGEATAKAIRNFEVYYNYDVTGRITKGLVNLLEQAGALI